MALNNVSLVFTEQDAGSGAATGSVVVAPTSAVVAAGITVVSQQPVVRAFGGGTVTVSLVATDNTGTTPVAGFWAYNITLPGGSPQTYLLPFSGGATQQFSNLTPAVASTTFGPAAGGSSGFSNPMTTLGDIMYENATPAAARLAGDTSNTRKFLRTQASSGVAQAPVWDTIAAGDLPFTQYPPDQFRPETYGAVNDRKVIADGAITSGQHDLTSPSNGFASAVAGQTVSVIGAGASGADLFTAIATVVSSGHVTTTAAAGTTVTAAGVIYGTDNTAAVQATINNAVTYAQANNRPVAVVGSAPYLCNSAPTIGGATKGNSILTLPIIPVASEKVVLTFRGSGWGADALDHWQQTTPQSSGFVLETTRLDGTVDATNGPASILGGPWAGYGGGTSLFSNMLVILDGVTFAVPWNSTYSGGNFFGVGEARVVSAGCIAQATVPSGTGFPQFAAGGPPSGTSYGLVMPDTNNNDLSDVLYYSAEGVSVALVAAEHVTVQSMRAIYCGYGIQTSSLSGSAVAHSSVTCHYLSAEACFAAVASTLGNAKINFTCIDVEGVTYILNDPSNFAVGYIGVKGNNTPGYNQMPSNGAANVRIIYLDAAPGPVASPQAPVASASPWANLYYRDVFITLAATTITALSIDSTAQRIPGSATVVNFTVPSGHSYTWTGTGTVGTNVFHTVTRL